MYYLYQEFKILNKMEKEFVPYEQAIALKELGFDESCFGYHTNDKDYPFILDVRNLENKYKEETKAPLYQQAFSFFREKYPQLDFAVGKIYNGTNNYHYHINLLWEYFEGTYEEAELECLKKLIEIVKEK